MRKKTNNLIFPLLVMGVFLVFASSCKKDDVPVLTTLAVTEITQTTAKSGGNITSDGGATITACGVCWSTGQTPTISDNKTTDGIGTGSFESAIVGLSANTTYYVRAYATNSNGTGYGSARSFTTQGGSAGSFIDFRDNNVYKFVTIGDQVWMAENLKYLPIVVGPGTGSQTTPYCYVSGYDGTNVNGAKATSNYTSYGVLYNWSAAMNGAASSTANPSGVQGVCPAGWHLPSSAEWTQLIDYLGGNYVAGGKLKATGTTHWNSPNAGATNETGFTALPGGERDNYGAFNYVGSHGLWWCSTEFDTIIGTSLCRCMFYNHSDIVMYVEIKDFGFPVRCVRD